MASYSKTRKLIQFRDHRGERRSLRLGKFTDRQAKVVKSHVEHLASAKASNTATPVETSIWLKEISDDLHRKLSRIGLVASRESVVAAQLESYFDGYIKSRTDLKPRSIINLKHVKSFAVKHFNRDRDLASITRGDVKDWHRALSEKYAKATVAMHVKKMRQLLADAMDRNIVTENPFRAVKAGSMSNAERMVYVPASDITKIIDSCPNSEWKMIFALARYAGLRVPSETRTLRWADFDFKTNRFTVRSPKTEHHAGKEIRVVPITPELLTVLLEAKMFAEAGESRLFLQLRGDNLGTTANKIIVRAGFASWAKTFQNLRSSCETDFAADFPLHVACAWIGNSAAVALKHYLQVKEQNFSDASKSAAPSAAVSDRQDQTQTERGAQNHSEKPMDLKIHYPQGVSNYPRKTVGNIQQAHIALQKALHGAKSRLGRERSRLIKNLAAAVAQAKARAA